MYKMIIEFDKEKVESKYKLSEIYEYLNEFARNENLKICENGIYMDNGNKHESTMSFMAFAGIISNQEWIHFASKWQWFEDDDEPQDLLRLFNHQPMSDIYIGELTLNMIFQAWGWVDFGDAYEWLQAYMRSGYADTFFILERNAFLI